MGNIYVKLYKIGQVVQEMFKEKSLRMDRRWTKTNHNRIIHYILGTHYALFHYFLAHYSL